MTLTTNDIAKLCHLSVGTVRDWFARNRTDERTPRRGHALKIKVEDWENWSKQYLVRDQKGKLRKRWGAPPPPAEFVGAPAGEGNRQPTKHLPIPELVAAYESHPILQVQRLIRVSTYAARVEQGQPIFGGLQ